MDVPHWCRRSRSPCWCRSLTQQCSGGCVDALGGLEAIIVGIRILRRFVERMLMLAFWRGGVVGVVFVEVFVEQLDKFCVLPLKVGVRILKGLRLLVGFAQTRAQLIELLIQLNYVFRLIFHHPRQGLVEADDLPQFIVGCSSSGVKQGLNLRLSERYHPPSEPSLILL